jgi:hypothetical protein
MASRERDVDRSSDNRTTFTQRRRQSWTRSSFMSGSTCTRIRLLSHLPGRYSRDDPHFVGTTRYSVISLTQALSRLGAPSELSICHEAGPCGYGLVRALREQGYQCQVVAPSRVSASLSLSRSSHDLAPLHPGVRASNLAERDGAPESAVVAGRRTLRGVQGDFLKAPSPPFTGAKRPSTSGRWCPFAPEGLSADRQAYAVRVLRGAFAWLVEVRYLRAIRRARSRTGHRHRHVADHPGRHKTPHLARPPRRLRVRQVQFGPCGP